jgi:hypothetical protein
MGLEASVPTYVYVVNEDENGHHYLLFPLDGLTLTNPLSKGQAHRLPGVRADQERYWQVDTVGGREHFVIFVSPRPLTSFEKTFAELPRGSEDAPVLSAPIGTNALNRLRGVGGIVTAPTPRLEQPLYEQYDTPLPKDSETTNGVWVRQFTVASTP